MMTQDRMAVPIPRLMRTLERDERGYPVPFLVWRDKDKRPHFTINDHTKIARCQRRFLCAICGKRMKDGYWFIGGARCFLHRLGAFLDPPVHLDCGEYALAVCPFLAARSYTKRIDARTVRPGTVPDDIALVRHEGMLPLLPGRFGLGLATSYRLTTTGAHVVDDWQYVEWWRNGERCEAPASAEPEPIP